MTNQYPTSHQSRQKAIKNKDTCYISETACKKCGSLVRYVSSMSCVICTEKRNRSKLDDPVLMAPYRTPEKKRQKQKVWRKNNSDKVSDQKKRNYNLHREKYYGYSLHQRYEMSLDEYKKLLIKQNSLCAICYGQTKRRLGIDHNHLTGKVRGLLCHRCNAGIGLFLENIQILKSAIEYLVQHEVR